MTFVDLLSFRVRFQRCDVYNYMIISIGGSSKVVLAYEGADYEELCRGFVVPDTWPKKPKKRRARSRSSWPDLKSSFRRPSRVFEVPKLTASGRRAFLRVEGSCVTRYDLGVCGSGRFRGVTHVFG